MIRYFKGSAGEFSYNDKDFKWQDDTLVYIHLKTKKVPKNIIPYGIKDCTNMFSGCSLVEPPDIPDTVTCCDGMFSLCENLTETPVIPDSVCSAKKMFFYCTSLLKVQNIPFI